MFLQSEFYYYFFNHSFSLLCHRLCSHTLCHPVLVLAGLLGAVVPCCLDLSLAHQYGECLCMPLLPGSTFAIRVGIRERYKIRVSVCIHMQKHSQHEGRICVLNTPTSRLSVFLSHVYVPHGCVPAALRLHVCFFYPCLHACMHVCVPVRMFIHRAVCVRIGPQSTAVTLWLCVRW